MIFLKYCFTLHYYLLYNKYFTLTIKKISNTLHFKTLENLCVFFTLHFIIKKQQKKYISHFTLKVMQFFCILFLYNQKNVLLHSLHAKSFCQSLRSQKFQEFSHHFHFTLTKIKVHCKCDTLHGQKKFFESITLHSQTMKFLVS